MPEPPPQPAHPELELRFVGGRLALVSAGRRGPVYVDFVAGAEAARRQSLSRRKHPLARAVGARPPLPLVMDATAGLGRDAMVLCSLGYRLIAAERDPCLHALLADGLRRAALHPALSALCAAFDLRCGAADAVLGEDETPDCIYLDPMFPPRSNSALVKKEMQVCQELLGHEDPSQSESLLAWARDTARQRVVVKRPRKAPPLAPRPNHSLSQKTVRWDVYLRTAAQAT